MIYDFNEFLNEEHNEIIIEVDKKTDFIDKLIDKLSFTYKKRKDRYVRPIKMIGSTTNGIKLDVYLSNKDILKISYNDDELKIKINDILIYYMDVKLDDVINKCYKIYTNYLKKDNFKIKDSNPFEQFNIKIINDNGEI